MSERKDIMPIFTHPGQISICEYAKKLQRDADLAVLQSERAKWQLLLDTIEDAWLEDKKEEADWLDALFNGCPTPDFVTDHIAALRKQAGLEEKDDIENLSIHNRL